MILRGLLLAVLLASYAWAGPIGGGGSGTGGGGGGWLNDDATDVTSNANTTEKTLYSFTVPGGTIGTGQCVDQTLTGTGTFETATGVTWRVRYGASGAVAVNVGAPAALSNAPVTIQAKVCGDGDVGAQRAWIIVWRGAAISSIQNVGAMAETSTSALAMSVTVQWSSTPSAATMTKMAAITTATAGTTQNDPSPCGSGQVVTDWDPDGTITCGLPSALAANGANADPGNAILGVDASGAAEGAFDVFTQDEADTHTADTAAHSATAANTASRIVTRDGSGNFAAGTITANLTGNASGTAANITGTAAIANGGTGQTSAQNAINALTQVSSATNEYVLTKDTGTGNAAWKAATGGGLSDGDKGDVTVGGSGTTLTVDNDVVTNAKAANVATATIKGRTTAGTGDPEDLTGAQATGLLEVFTSGAKGLAPASGGGTTNFLRADGTWAAAAGGSVTLDQAFDNGKGIDGANSEENALDISDGTTGKKSWAEGGVWHEKVYPDQDMVSTIPDGFDWILQQSDGTDLVVVDETTGVIAAQAAASIDNSAAASTKPFRSAAGAAPTTANTCAYDSTANRYKCGNGSSANTLAWLSEVGGGGGTPRCGLIDCVAPNNGDFSDLGTAATITTAAGGLVLTSTVSGSVDYNYRVVTLGSAPYTYILGFIPQLNATFNVCGLALIDHATGAAQAANVIIQSAGPRMVVSNFDSTTDSSTTEASTPINFPMLFPAEIFFKVDVDESNNRVWSWSATGASWVPLHSTTNTTHITPTRAGFFCGAINATYPAAMGVNHWVVQ